MLVFLIIVIVALCSLCAFYAQMYKLRDFEAKTWKGKFQQSDSDKRELLSDYRRIESKYNRVLNELEREQLKLRVSSRVDEVLESTMNESKDFAKNKRYEKKLKVESDVKPNQSKVKFNRETTVKALLVSE